MTAEVIVKERSILFSGEMVRATMDDRKTKTRRVIKPQPEHVWGFGVRHGDPEYFSAHVRYSGGHQPDPWIHCPYGKPGDKLWVRETWGLWDTDPEDGPENATIFWKATDLDIDHLKHQLRYQLWRPSIFMPRWASRITLEVTGVRVERLHEITPDEAYQEGVGNNWQPESNQIATFSRLWDSLNAKRGYSWESNPWVWVIEFKRITP
jgi:hypothetical protein